MADTPQNINLSRFVRPIGVTGLGTAGTGRTADRMRTLGDSFDGVLATSVSAEAGAPLADLSYLTLAPLVTRGLGGDERDGGPDRTALGEPTSGDQEREGASCGPEGDELRVRELLRTDGDETADGRALRPTEMTVSEPHNRSIDADAGERDSSTGSSEQTERSDERSSLSGWDGQRPERGGDGPEAISDWAADRSEREPPRSVVERSSHEGQRSELDRASAGHGSEDGEHPSSSTDGAEIGQQFGRSGARGPDDAVPKTVVHRGDSESGGRGGVTGGQTGPASNSPADQAAPSNGRGAPGLTVTGPGATEVSTNTEGVSVPAAGDAQRQSRATSSQREESDDVTVTERTVIRSDGRLNERVFDRLYDEVSRKMRMERDRGGR